MSDQEINIAIAELVNGDSEGPFHNYCNDLNAMHEAEKVLIEKCKEGNYWFHLREILEFPDAESDWDHYYYLSAIHATAKQRAEAFLRTLGKLEETK